MNTVAAAHQRLDRLEPKIDTLEKDVASLQTEVDVQFREVFGQWPRGVDKARAKRATRFVAKDGGGNREVWADH